MLEALAISQPRHLSLPESCLFSPTELSIAAGTSESDFVRIVKAVTALDQAEDAWKGDAALFAIKTWGKKHGLELTASASGYKAFSLQKAAHVAEEFPPERRANGFTWSHYRALLPFPREWGYEFIKRHAAEHIPSSSFRALAEKEFGGDPYKNRQPRKRSVLIREDLYALLRPHSPNRKVHILIERVLSEWVRIQPDVPVHTKTAVQSSTDEDVQTQRPTYAGRRKKQIAAGAKPIPAKEGRPKSKPSIKVSWTECAGESFIDTQNGAACYRGKCGSKPTKFQSEADAIAAEQKHFEDRGYHERVGRCEVCKCWHVYHIFCSEVAK